MGSVLITGGRRGLGYAMVKKFIASGAHVITTCTTPEGAQSLKQEFPSAEVLCWRAEDGASALQQACAPWTKDLDGLIANAGMTSDQWIIRMRPEQWRHVYEVNTQVHLELGAWALRQLSSKNQGYLIFLSSVVAHTGNLGQANYIVSKAALEGAVKAFALEGGKRGVRANAIAPGWIDTDMTQGLSDEQRQAVLKRIPLERMGTPEEVADLCFFLSKASYITGQVLHINGGLFLGG